MRVVGVDVGQVRVGLAISDPEGVVAQPLDVVEATPEAVAERIEGLGVERIVVGIPLSMDGSSGRQAAAAREFAMVLEKQTGLPVDTWDERLSTVEAERAMRSAGTKARQQRGKVDKVAAALVLQSYLERQRS